MSCSGSRRTKLTLKAAGRGLHPGYTVGAVQREVRRGPSQEVAAEPVDDGVRRAPLVRTPPSVVEDRGEVARHRLRRGAMTSRLDVHTGAGQHHVVLWMRNDGGMAPIARAMDDVAAHRAAFEA